MIFDWGIFEASLGPISAKKLLNFSAISKLFVIWVVFTVTLLGKGELTYLLLIHF